MSKAVKQSEPTTPIRPADRLRQGALHLHLQEAPRGRGSAGYLRQAPDAHRRGVPGMDPGPPGSAGDLPFRAENFESDSELAKELRVPWDARVNEWEDRVRANCERGWPADYMERKYIPPDGVHPLGWTDGEGENRLTEPGFRGESPSPGRPRISGWRVTARPRQAPRDRPQSD
jgi:hypothetical protein